MGEYYEREMDMPTDWVSNVIFQRDDQGNVIQVIVPDDVDEVTNDVADN